MIEQIIDFVLLAFLAMTAIAVARLRDLFAIVMLFGIYSLLTASIFVSLDAVDVAFTEAAVGAGISTILMLATIALTSRQEKQPKHSILLPLLVVFVTGAVLIYGTLDMPAFGDPNAPVHQHVAPHYLEKAYTETGVPNIVTAVLASYRGYDTMGEVTVIFTAGIAVLLLLSASGHPREDLHKLENISHHVIPRMVSRLFIPFILLFALYVQFHGDYGPGGGFQAGVIFAAGFILYGLVASIEQVRSMFKPKALQIAMASGVLLYISVGFVSLFLGGTFLDYNVLASDPVKGQHWGIFLVELGVGITVAATMISLFLTFSEVRNDAA